MPKDGKKLSFSSNFDSPKGVSRSKFATSEAALLHADDKPCIYEYSKKNSNDQIVVTGCENEIREIQIQRKNSAPFYGKIHRDGKVDEIEFPPKKDKVVYPDDFETAKNTNKTKGFRGLINDFIGGIVNGGGINIGGGGINIGGGGINIGGGGNCKGGGNAQLPPCMDLEVYLYYGPSFEQSANRESGGNAEAKAMRIASHAKNHYLHHDFPTKINIITTVKRLEKDTNSLQAVGSLVPKENLQKGRLHALLIGQGQRLGGNTVGIAFAHTACREPGSYGAGGPFSINVASRSDMSTGETLAHELAHNLGVEHDFETGRRGHTCGPGIHAPGGSLMNYGKPMGKEIWSKCSREDFTKYFQCNQPFCLKTSKLIF